MGETIKLILSLSVSGGLFSLVLLAMKPLLRNRLSKSFQYYIWLVVLLRFIVPFSFGINLMDFTFNDLNEPQAAKGTVISNNPVNPANANPAVGNAGNNNVPTIAEQQPSMPGMPDSAESFDAVKTLMDNLLWIWLAGAVISAAWNILGYLRFIRYVHGAAYAMEMPDCNARVYKSRFAPTPMLVGVIKPRIYLPDIEYTDGQLDNILLHELTHLRRCDVWLKWFATLVVSVHWFNPIVYLMRREFNRACELSCDETVIRKLDGAAKQSYGDTLISVVAESRYLVGVMSVTMCEEKKKLKERLIAIMNYKKKTKIALLITAVLAVVITGSAFAFGAGTPLSSVFAQKETTYRYGFHLGEKTIEDVLLPVEYEFTGRYTYNGDDLTSRLVEKVLFTYKDTEYYFYYNSRGLEYLNTVYPDLYNANTDEKIATFWEKPQGMIMLDNYLYYAYGSERRVREYNWHNLYPYYMWYKDYHYARLNLDTMQSEKITRTQYEETWDYQEFRQWRSTVTEPIKKLDVFVWLDYDTTKGGYNGYNGRTYKDGNYDTYYTLKDGDNPKYKADWYEYFIFHFKDEPTFSVYNAPNLITNSIADLDKMIAKFPNVETITIYQMNDTDFSEQEMVEFVGNITTPNEWCEKILLAWSNLEVSNSNETNAPQITLYEYDGNPGLDLGKALTKEETGWVRLTGMVFIEVKVPDGAMTVKTYYAEAGTEAAEHQMLDSKYSAPHKNPPVPNEHPTGNSFNVADYYPNGFLGHIWAVITDADGVEHSSEIINVIYEPGKSYTPITGNVINGNVSAINVELSIVWEGLSPRKYTSTDKIQAVTDYVNGLKLKEFPEKENTYNGATFTITVSYDDGTEEVFYHAGNMLFGYNINGEFTWKRMEYEQAAKFDSIIRNNPSD